MGNPCSVPVPDYDTRPPRRLGINWEEWEKTHKPPLYYDPPQLKAHALYTCNVWSRRPSPWCMTPPCCCGQVLRDGYMKPCMGMDVVKLSEPEEWFLKMLTTGASPNCPDEFKGIWWTHDNLAHENLVTFHDGNWVSPDVMVKYCYWNWSVDLNSIWGNLLPVYFRASFGVSTGKLGMTYFERSPNKKWINMGGGGHWIYVVGPEDEFFRRDGTIEVFEPGEELLRLEYNSDSSDEEPWYQYRVQRVAYLDENGKLVLTKFYDELKRRALMDPPQVGCCCNHFVCLHGDKDTELLLQPVSDLQGVVYAPPAPGAEAKAEAKQSPLE